MIWIRGPSQTQWVKKCQISPCLRSRTLYFKKLLFCICNYFIFISVSFFLFQHETVHASICIHWFCKWMESSYQKRLKLHFLIFTFFGLIIITWGRLLKAIYRFFILDSSLEPNHCNTYKALGMLIIKGAGALLLPLGDVPNREEVLVLPIQVRTWSQKVQYDKQIRALALP